MECLNAAAVSPGEPGHLPGLQRRRDVVPAESGGLADTCLGGPVGAGGEQRVGFLQRGETLAVVVGDVHVEELPGLVALPLGVQVIGNLGEPELVRSGQPPVPLDHPVAAAPVRGD